jgi:hypothetical protein
MRTPSAAWHPQEARLVVAAGPVEPLAAAVTEFLAGTCGAASVDLDRLDITCAASSAAQASIVVDSSGGPPSNAAQVPSARCCDRIQRAASSVSPAPWRRSGCVPE